MTSGGSEPSGEVASRRVAIGEAIIGAGVLALAAVMLWQTLAIPVSPIYAQVGPTDRKSTRLNSSHLGISYAVFRLKKKKTWGNRGQRPTEPTAAYRPDPASPRAWARSARALAPRQRADTRTPAQCRTTSERRSRSD